VLAVFAPGPASAQTTEQLLGQRRLELRAALATFEAARRAYNVEERQFSTALNNLYLAQRQGDSGEVERARAEAHERSVPLGDREVRLNEARDSLVRVRQALIDVIEVRLEQLVDQMDRATNSARRNELDALWRDLFNELQQLEAEAGDPVRLAPVVLPAVASDPRDTPEDKMAKALLLERLAGVADTLIQQTEQEIETLNRRLRDQRRLGDFMAGTDRFDDTRVPVVTGAPGGTRLPSADSTVAGQRPITLEERIEALGESLEQLRSYRDQLLIRARVFREQVRQVAE
jgi:hypothetical protein